MQAYVHVFVQEKVCLEPTETHKHALTVKQGGLCASGQNVRQSDYVGKQSAENIYIVVVAKLGSLKTSAEDSELKKNNLTFVTNH